MKLDIENVTRTLNFALLFGCDLGESADGKIDRVVVDARRAVI